MLPSDMQGVRHGMAREEYDAAPGENWSALKWMERSPAHYREQKRQRAAGTQADTDAKRFGRAVHLSVLEPDRFPPMVAVWTGGRRYGKEWDRFCEENAGREILTAAEHARCVAIQRAVRAHDKAGSYLQSGSGEVSVFWALDGRPCKGRLDFLSHAIVDLKTTRDASLEGFDREAWRYRYHAQAAYYVDGYEAATGKRLPYVIVAVEVDAPHVVTVRPVPDALLELGRDEYRAHLLRLAECERTGQWPGYFADEQALAPPRWARPFSDDEDLAGMDLAIGGTDAL